jgi:hypothetical protein
MSHVTCFINNRIINIKIDIVTENAESLNLKSQILVVCPTHMDKKDAASMVEQVPYSFQHTVCNLRTQNYLF